MAFVSAKLVILNFNQIIMELPMNHTLPSGVKVHLRADEVLCECGYVSVKNGKCIRCSEGGESFFKELKKKKK